VRKKESVPWKERPKTKGSLEAKKQRSAASKRERKKKKKGKKEKRKEPRRGRKRKRKRIVDRRKTREGEADYRSPKKAKRAQAVLIRLSTNEKEKRIARPRALNEED